MEGESKIGASGTWKAIQSFGLKMRVNGKNLKEK